ncbi:acyl-CoA thioesterase [Salinicoccus roseus]|uniref:acyl-CoA thioesterase n=1 Tax=Salinicoccus roseus TaxID=45670 RepID=UPI001EF6167D|nr:acyl-CoA thioesterase [Salinicoccus roseus]MCG7332474.1 acyl-CoA thioesterase [Salinicoccus roseus]
MTDFKNPKDSKVISIDQVFANDLNNYDTLFGGVLMKRIDNVASLAARRHARVKECVTASIDSIDFLHPITQAESVCIEAFVTSTGNHSMEVFCKVITEDLVTEDRKVAATAFLTFVALDEETKRPIPVPGIVPETDEEKYLYESNAQRTAMRRERRNHSKELTTNISIEKPWNL